MRNISKVRFKSLELAGVGDPEIWRFHNICRDELDMRLDLEKKLSELLSDEAWKRSAAVVGESRVDLPPAPVIKTVLTCEGSLTASYVGAMAML